MKNILSLTGVRVSLMALVLLCTASCTDNFGDYNKRGDQPTAEEMTRPVLLNSMIQQMQNYVIPVQENAYQMSENLIGHIYGRYFATTNGGWSTTFSFFNAGDGWINSPYNDVFPKTYEAWGKVKELTEAEGVYYSWAQILRIAAMHRMTDMYGPIPYSKLSEGTGGIAAAYDSQDIVYKQMIDDLDAAIDEITLYVAANPSDRSMYKADLVYGGDFSKWLKFARSLKFRILMRMVYADEAYAKAGIRELMDNESLLMDSNGDNANITVNRNPLNVMWDSYSDCRVAADIVTYMEGYSDPRMSAYFAHGEATFSNGKYNGLRVGILLDKNWSLKYSTPNEPESKKTVLWMPASEIAFLKAEAKLRWSDLPGGTAEDYYREAVRLSFEQHAASGYDTYIENDTKTQAAYVDPNLTPNNSTAALSTITIKWESTDTDEQNLERIITQKWIALYPLGTEAWSEHRRTGYPRFFSVPRVQNTDASLATRLASRIPFPPDERLNNTANYNGAVSLLGGADNYSTRLWWDKKVGKPNW
ncbi:SusD/RagB family nutrient-binding outer membrane lipoprotein [Dysgonomonas sp. 25]|uniref:SusD/RagB family nutrient-binding outer membrane lipoprotein n=1 Tax=Dysgonomonas sp. 25 TaxID=2302933 RepID=UPI0013D6223D|nr:SusD/RagB family nutrient-binding outer membrane lipoprotein [Dysgonomonas sp. 25]NDV68839.1 SusD/RagB family nutrient-binding outer membrane lipoprotein [Dysgonomonas sp. 25]